MSGSRKTALQSRKRAQVWLAAAAARSRALVARMALENLRARVGAVSFAK